ncbi:DNAJ protein JJJ1 homolog [Macadamia integrifolia]|uniref:DNAJ protein JJJ1 homolog n=1 Tax=Macadamia integrifolia TaxID=60698 RepID=UPI001C4FFF10|nr:DNAJ protein JJJ1 homolog [Macadamia integrifolia]
MAPVKRCLYEVLGLSRDCSPEEIRSAYKKLALQRHPDKLIQTGVPEEEATAAFQELVNAYEVLSDPRERTWYDSHRSQILFSDAKSSKPSSSQIPDLFSFFSNSVFSGFGDTGKGFFKVYGDLFGKLYAFEVSFAQKLGLGQGVVRDAPLMGNLESPYAQVSAFYNYWLGFVTVLDFCWVDEYDVLAGPNRKSRRLMEEENKKFRKKARKEYNDTVRGLAEFVKKRDKRVIDMQMKRNQEQEKRREEERIRKKEAQQAKLAKARLYEEPEWAKVDEEELENAFDEPEDDEKQNNTKELYCVVCSKKFKSEKQWKNHEQSKKHREKVAELKESFDAEDELDIDDNGDDSDNNEKGPLESDAVETHEDFPEEESMAELQEQFKDGLGFQEEETEVRNPSSPDKGSKVSDISDQDEVGPSFGSDEETSTLEAMVSGHIKNRKNAARRHEPNSCSDEGNASYDGEETDFMDYNPRKTTRRSRTAKGEGDKKPKGDVAKAELSETTEGEIPITNGSNIESEEGNEDGNGHMQDSLSHPAEFTGTDGKGDKPLGKDHKVLNQTVGGKGVGRKDTNAKSKNSSKGKKQKPTSKKSGNTCETCGENFESRTKLHKHLGDTGHATLKLR